ncbi:MAG: 16S rRNA (uracil(1498)-N(3))-methyltransferase [Acidobacteriota bacterium]
MYRAFIRVVSPQIAEVPSQEAHHLVKVRRLSQGDRFLGLDGEGGLFRCRLERGGQGWMAQIEEQLSQQSESPLEITLAQALLKKENFEWVIQKSAELGVRRIAPLISVRTEVRPRLAGAERKQARWQKILAEAVKQSGRLRLPGIQELAPLEEFCKADESEVRLVLDEASAIPLREILDNRPPPLSCSLIIGPEGGWDDQDREVFQRRSLHTVHLGPRILRAETAPIAALAILQYRWGDMERKVVRI